MRHILSILLLGIAVMCYGEAIRSNIAGRYVLQCEEGVEPLPEGLTAVRYLESTGTQYIHTGLLFQKNIRLIVSVEYTGTTTFGWGRNYSSYEILWQGSRFYFGGGYSIIESREYNRQYEYDLDFTDKNMVAKINGEIVRETTGTQPTDGYILLFALYRPGLADPIIEFPGRHYYFFLFVGDELIMNLVPCRFINEVDENEGAMYDRISGNLFRNQGTGSFIIGPDL